MVTTYISKPPQSGNHGRSSTELQQVGIGSLVPSTAPQQSTRGFVAPTSVPIKKTPNITDIIEVRREEGESGRKKVENEEIEKHTEFSSSWQTMFNQVFASVPTIYIPLKDSIPEINNNIIKVIVKNDVQKEHFEAKIREVLEFLRTHYDEKIEDVTVESNEKLVTKKIIYDVKDKLQNFKEQNEEFEDFLQILDLAIKY